MLPRLIALVIAVCTAATGLLPAGDVSRCISMQVRMQAGEPCCPRCEAPPATSIGKACCETVHVASVGERVPASSQEVRIAPAPFAGLLALPPVVRPAEVALRRVAALPRGRPDGERIDLLSTILRV